jgi:hypothetical protein
MSPVHSHHASGAGSGQEGKRLPFRMHGGSRSMRCLSAPDPSVQALQPYFVLRSVEATTGIEPVYAVLQTAP